MSAYDTIKEMARELATTSTRADRVKMCGEIVGLLQALEVSRPATPDALSSAYEDGALRAMEISQDVRREHEESFKAARFSAAGIVLNGVENYGQALISQAESRVSRHLNERRKKAAP